MKNLLKPKSSEEILANFGEETLGELPAYATKNIKAPSHTLIQNLSKGKLKKILKNVENKFNCGHNIQARTWNAYMDRRNLGYKEIKYLINAILSKRSARAEHDNL